MIKSIYDYNFKDKKVLIRVDFNVPQDAEQKITDNNRIVESLPTIKKVLLDGGMPILMSHLGRPKGKVNLKYSLKPIAVELAKLIDVKIHFAEDCIGEPAETAVANAKMGEIVVLENLRFRDLEEANDQTFAEGLAKLADVYINDAFGAAHRAHASIDAVARMFRDRFAGALMIKEVEFLKNATENPKRPYLAIIGGAKISGKIDVISHLMSKCDSIIIGGGMAFTFFKAMGYEIGKSILEEDKIDVAKDVIVKAKANKVSLLLPLDIVVAEEFNETSKSWEVDCDKIPANCIGMDIGVKTCEKFAKEILNSKTIVWNGPMGVFEMDKFAKGTKAIELALATAKIIGATSIVGGGDSAAAIAKFNLQSSVSHVSTGGGASLEMLEGKELPGILALEV